MNQRWAQSAFIGFNVLAIPAVLYPLYELYRISIEVAAEKKLVTYDKGDFYFVLMSLFWLMWIIQKVGLKGGMGWVAKWAKPLLVGWFIGCLSFAILTPKVISYGLTKSGYQQCEVPEDPARRMGGGDMWFSLTDCPHAVSR
jgi:energy-coupling factor transporter transmembrane protein EcfT